MNQNNNIAVTIGDILRSLAGLLLSLWYWLLKILLWLIATFKNLAPLIVLLLIFGIFYAIRGILREMEKHRYLTLEDFFGLTPVSSKRTLQAWEVIDNRLKNKDPDQYKLAVIEADDLFFDLLLALGHRGETFEERLRWFRPDKLKNMDDIETAHEMAEKLFDDNEAQITQEGATKIIKVYQNAFKELGVIEKEKGEEKGK